jgi:hypothetical protein
MTLFNTLFRQVGAGVIIAGNLAFKKTPPRLATSGLRQACLAVGVPSLQVDQPTRATVLGADFNPATFTWNDAGSS